VGGAGNCGRADKKPKAHEREDAPRFPITESWAGRMAMGDEVLWDWGALRDARVTKDFRASPRRKDDASLLCDCLRAVEDSRGKLRQSEVLKSDAAA